MGSTTTPGAERDCHELLLRLAGRLPDDLLWRYRDWLAGGALDVLARALPRTLLHDRIGCSEREHRLLRNALSPLGADPAALAALSVRPERPDVGYEFTSDPPDRGGADPTLVVLGAALRGRPGVREVRCCWRRSPHGDVVRVVLVTATGDLPGLTGELQRMLRALGEHEPVVEVLPTDLDPPAYHRAALRTSELVSTGADVVPA
ncbi:hypothetical protein [Longimycelium tulufanense]|nr:hypothetical protein [Longimycelium tulufanense]